MAQRNLLLFAGVGLLFVATGVFQSWNLSLQILNIGILSAIIALGVNMQWGYAGLFSTGIMGSVALGGLAVVLVSGKPVPEGWAAGGPQLLLALAFGVGAIAAAVITYTRMAKGRARNWIVAAIMVGGFFAFRALFDPAVSAIEAFTPATAGNIGGRLAGPPLARAGGGVLGGVAALGGG